MRFLASRGADCDPHPDWLILWQNCNMITRKLERFTCTLFTDAASYDGTYHWSSSAYVSSCHSWSRTTDLLWSSSSYSYSSAARIWLPTTTCFRNETWRYSYAKFLFVVSPTRSADTTLWRQTCWSRIHATNTAASAFNSSTDAW